MNEFINELILSKGKNCLIFVVTDSARDLIERIGSNEIEIIEIHITRNENPLETLIKWNDSNKNTVYAVHGMKSAFPEILGYLNLHRDLFYDIKRPVVIMGSDHEISEIARYAPDFWRFRRSTYDFT